MAEVGAAILTTVVGAVVTTALQELVKRINEEVDTSIDSINRRINQVNEKVRIYEGRRKDTTDEWRGKIAKLRSLSCDIEDYIDKLKIKKITSKMFATQITKIESEFKEHADDLEKYMDQPQGPSQAGQHAIPDHNGKVFDGRDEARKDLVALVLNSRNQQVTKVICIVGSGGIGKTCLAVEVLRNQEVGQSFRSAFVCATGMNIAGVVQAAEQKLTATPSSATQRYDLIVVDNVQDQALGSGVISGLRSRVIRADGGIIILTTTVQELAKNLSFNNVGHVYQMRPICVESSGSLFTRQYTAQAPVDESDRKLVEKECDGVPLAVITWAKYWNRDHSRCKTIWTRLGEGDYRLEEMDKVLQHSYRSLPTIDQRTCLLYLSMFRRREDDSIRRGSMVRRWLAEGSEVGCGNLDNNHIEAFSNWKRLVDWNAVMCPIVHEDEVGAKTCRPSRAMLGYISHESRLERFARQCSAEACPPTGIRRLCLQKQAPVGGILTREGAVSGLRTLVVSPEKDDVKIKAADLSFDKCRLLRVLDLQACSGPDRIKIIPEVCKKLKLLRYLSLRSDFIGIIPQQIKQLKYLETLDLGKNKFVKVHVDVLRLPELKHLVGKFKLDPSWEVVLNKGKFEAKKLETLAGFLTHRGKGFPLLMKNMGQLRKVKVFFHPNASATTLSNRLADAITAFLPVPPPLPLPPVPGHRCKDHDRRKLSIDIQECDEPTDDVLSCLNKVSGVLYSLKLSGTSILIALPSFIGKLNSIEKLCISFTTLSWQRIIDECHRDLPQLKFLKLVEKDSSSSNIAVCNQPIAGPSTTTVVDVLRIQVHQFENLERMYLQSSRALPKIEIQDGALTRLVSLHLISSGIGNPTDVICNCNSTNNGIPLPPPVNNNPNNVANNGIPPLNSLKEVALQSSSPVIDSIKMAWHQAARDHPKTPQVIFIDA